MRKSLLLVLLMTAVSVSSWAQMSEDRIIQYVIEQQEKGMSQEQIVYNLSRRGVTVRQLQQMRDRYEKQQATGVLGNTIPSTDVSGQRTRTSDQTLNLIPHLIIYIVESTEVDVLVVGPRVVDFGYEFYCGKSFLD